MPRILLADDEPAVREFVRRALTVHGHEVTAVADGAEALVALSQGEFDLLLTDIVMPVMDGIALALKVAKDYPALRILMMTGYSAERERAHNLHLLVHDVLAKPFTMDQICSAVTAVLAAPHGR
jgi:CheY-like chemotaxis protein